MKVLTIQSSSLIFQTLVFGAGERTYPIGKTNYPQAYKAYQHLFDDYNRIKGTNYSNFFWGFTELYKHSYKENLKRALEMIGLSHSKGSRRVFILDVPDELCLETDFYNFSDEIFASNHPEELTSNWDSIYDLQPNREKQVIFPYLDYSMILSRDLIELEDFY